MCASVFGVVSTTKPYIYICIFLTIFHLPIFLSRTKKSWLFASFSVFFAVFCMLCCSCSTNLLTNVTIFAFLFYFFHITHTNTWFHSFCFLLTFFLVFVHFLCYSSHFHFIQFSYALFIYCSCLCTQTKTRFRQTQSHFVVFCCIFHLCFQFS